MTDFDNKESINTNKKLKNKKSLIIWGTILALFICVSMGLWYYDNTLVNNDKIISDVYFLNENLNGMSKDDVETKITAAYKDILDDQIKIKASDQTFTYTFEEMGVAKNSADLTKMAYDTGRTGNIFNRYMVRWGMKGDLKLIMSYEKDDNLINNILDEIDSQISIEPQNATYKISGKTLTLVPSKNGILINRPESILSIDVALASLPIEQIELVVDKEVTPEITTEKLQSMKIDGVLSTFSTNYRTSQVDRTHNMKTACNSINETLVMPGETFSFNDVVGPRTKDRGYREAYIIENNVFTPGLGGGICQVSTTLYSSAIRAGVTIVERRHHSIPITYVRLGQDAMVSWGSSDFKFRNDYSTPVLIQAQCSSGVLTMTFFGDTSLVKDIKVVSDVVRTIPYNTITKIDASLKPGEVVVKSSGNAGKEVYVYRQEIVNGKVVSSKQISHDTYNPQTRIILKGPEKEPEGVTTEGIPDDGVPAKPTQ